MADAVGEEPASLELVPSFAAFSLDEYSALQRLAVQRLPASGLPLSPRQMTQDETMCVCCSHTTSVCVLALGVRSHRLLESTTWTFGYVDMSG